jgi:ribosomal protein L40E
MASVTMVNCYVHTDRMATGSCAICGKGICRECSNRAPGDIYLCAKCWQEIPPVINLLRVRERKVTAPPTGAGLSRALYYATALIIVAIGSLYVYATFIAPVTLPPGGALPVFDTSTLGGIWSRYGLLITVSVGMFMVVLIGGELMLRNAPKQPRTVATRPRTQPAPTAIPPATVPAMAEVDFGSKSDGRESQRAVTQPRGQALSEPLQTVPKRSQPAVTHPELKPPTQTRLVHCIYCGNKIPPTAVFCSRCGKGQQ